MIAKPLTWCEPAFAGLIGVGRRDITPPAGIYARNWGAALHDVAEGIHMPLLCTTMTIRAAASDTPLVLAAIDATWFRGPEGAIQLRDHVCRELGLPAASLMISLSHTHSGPSISPAEESKPGGDRIRPYVGQVARAIVDSAREALRGECECELRFGMGACTLAADRDLPDPVSKRFVCGFNPSVTADHTCLVGRVSRRDTGVTTATIVNYACHPTTLGASNRLISPDYVGSMRAVVESQTSGAPCLFLQGASGELAPRTQYVDDSDVADSHGRQLGFAAVATLEALLPPGKGLALTGVLESGAPLAQWHTRDHAATRAIASTHIAVELPLKASLWSENEIRLTLDACADRAMKERMHRELLVARTVAGHNGVSTRPVWIWKLGDILLVGQSDEAYSRYQQELRAAYPRMAVVVMNVVNGWGGYICPAERYQQQIYQSQQSPYASGCLETLIAKTREGIDNLLSHATASHQPQAGRHARSVGGPSA